MSNQEIKEKMKTLPERFRTKVDTSGECWIWKRHTGARGYGRIRVKGVMYLAHRHSWKLFNGDIPEGLNVLHKCDNPSCVNPNHLFLGTLGDNMRDMVAKNRNHKAIGEDHPTAKLTQIEVDEIRKTYIKDDRHYGCYGLAKIYKVRPGTIWRIIAYKSWKEAI